LNVFVGVIVFVVGLLSLLLLIDGHFAITVTVIIDRQVECIVVQELHILHYRLTLPRWQVIHSLQRLRIVKIIQHELYFSKIGKVILNKE